MLRHGCSAVLLALFPAVVQALATSYHLPQPWRETAVVDGRELVYSQERFLHAFSFRHAQAEPTAIMNGVRGTGGSLSSRRLFFDFRYRQDFAFNEGRQGFIADIQRSEDFDGTFDRQLVGFRHNLTDRTELWLQGDVFADKSQSDIYLSARHHLPGGGWVHGAWIFPNAYFNDKTLTSDRFAEPPQSLFLQWHHPQGDAISTLVSATYSLPSTFISRSHNLTVEDESLKAALTHRRASENWRVTINLTAERTRRAYQLHDRQQSPGFDRQYVEAGAELTYIDSRLEPSLGARVLRLREQGYFGRNLDLTGNNDRLEPLLHGSIALNLSPRTVLRPAVYLAYTDIQRNLGQDPALVTDEASFIGKLSLPFEFILGHEGEGRLTLAPTLLLHEAGFGGGNLQLQWPM